MTKIKRGLQLEFFALGVAMLHTCAWAIDSKTCGQCHAAIYRQYSLTPMARTSAAANNANVPPSGGEVHDESGATTFRLRLDAQGAFLHFSQGDTEGERALTYVIGAGVIGRSYASMIDGFLFQAPVSHYTGAGTWDLSPGFEGSDRLNLTRPIEPACLNCHASGLRVVPGTVNGYLTPAFDEQGVSCERCHGAGETHVAKVKTGDIRQGAGILNPAKMPLAERDSVCAQCHLVSVIRIAKADGAAPYAPGKRLFDSTSAFLWSNGKRESRANSHFEQLVSSACWRGSAGRLWCGTCHSVHGAPVQAAGGISYRKRCLTCHAVNAPACSGTALARVAVKDDCVRCHMPAQSIGTVQHAAQVDHTISRVPQENAEQAVPFDSGLIPFPGSTAGERELGLAYASEALPRNNHAWGMRAVALLEGAAVRYPSDGAVELQLGQLYDRMGRDEQSCELFAKAVSHGVPGTAALVNLGACQAKQADLEGAMRSWTKALNRNPALEAARLNLAVAKYQTGQIESTRAELRIALRYDPFSERVREAARTLLGQTP